MTQLTCTEKKKNKREQCRVELASPVAMYCLVVREMWIAPTLCLEQIHHPLMQCQARRSSPMNIHSLKWCRSYENYNHS
jgi:hypothetical protein